MINLRVDNECELRPFVESDADVVFAKVIVNYEHLHPFLLWVNRDYSLKSAKEFIKQTQKALLEKTSQELAIIYKDKFIGSIGFVGFSWNSKRTEIGYWIAKDFEGQGIITKCCKFLVDYAFEELKMNRVEIRCATENVRSRAVPERLGFKLEGILRQSIWRHKRYYDLA